MLKRTCVLLTVGMSAAPALASAQTLGFGGRVGTLGLGGEVAVDLTEELVLRGGIGVVPIEPSATFSDLELTLTLPTVWNVGLDLYVNSAMRIGGGMLFRRADPMVTGQFDSPQEIGGTTYTPGEIGTLHGVFDGSDSAPYVLIGFGKHTAAGIGLFIDFGVAFVGEPDVRLDASGGSLDPNTDAAFRNALDQEAADFEADTRGYLKLWPILNLGVRLGAR
ncbi:MAG: hypothetical protein PVJ80_17815 [Gemmatimonadota bacterium]|jgi:hypothetical protein